MKSLILVVDDNLLNRKLAGDLLEMEGHEVHQCDDAAEALDWLARGRTPDLVLMDISLPGMDGLTLTRQLKAEPRYAHMPVVAMTAFAMKGDEQKALDAGCSGYITKPVDTRRLPAQVAEYIAAAKSAPPREGLKVMIVEDHRIDMKLAGESARLSGHVVLSSSTAEQALERDPRAVLDDVLDGFVSIAAAAASYAAAASRGPPASPRTTAGWQWPTLFIEMPAMQST